MSNTRVSSHRATNALTVLGKPFLTQHSFLVQVLADNSPLPCGLQDGTVRGSATSARGPRRFALDFQLPGSDAPLRKLICLKTFCLHPLWAPSTMVSQPRATCANALADGTNLYRGGAASGGTQTRSPGGSCMSLILPFCSNAMRFVKPALVDATFVGVAEALQHAAWCICRIAPRSDPSP